MMNERIAALYDQSLVLHGNGDYVAGELDVEKFAELIVKECINRIDRLGVMEWDENGAGMYIDALKEHFGVE